MKPRPGSTWTCTSAPSRVVWPLGRATGSSSRLAGSVRNCSPSRRAWSERTRSSILSPSMRVKATTSPSTARRTRRATWAAFRPALRTASWSSRSCSWARPGWLSSCTSLAPGMAATMVLSASAARWICSKSSARTFTLMALPAGGPPASTVKLLRPGPPMLSTVWRMPSTTSVTSRASSVRGLSETNTWP
ncbi:hypothetical protein FQZ97_965250 [compost metagenome]